MRNQSRRLYHIPTDHRFYMDEVTIAPFRTMEPNWGPLGKVAYVRTYARELRGAELVEHLVRDKAMDKETAKKEARKLKMVREEFWQTARRCVEFAIGNFKHTALANHRDWTDAKGQKNAAEMFQRLWDGKWLPPGRGLQFAGTPVVEIKGAGAICNCGFRSTLNIGTDFAEPFCTIMNFLMLGVGMGSDVAGAGLLKIVQPEIDTDYVHTVADTREGWVEALRVTLLAYTGRIKAPREFDYSKIRKEGKQLKTFGGTSSGYAPLKKLLEAVQAILNKEIDKLISATAIADIVNQIGCCVVAGNIRRSAEILLGRSDDKEFMSLKDPGELRTWEAEKALRSTQIPEVVRLNTRRDRLQRRLKKLDTASADYTKLSTRVVRFNNRIYKALAADTEWSAIQNKINNHPLYTHRWASNNSVLCKTDEDFTQLGNQIATNGEPGVIFMDNVRAFGRMSKPADWVDIRAAGTNPCSEQTLEDGELCCLGELNPNAHQTFEDFLVTIKYAYMYCKAVTLVPTDNPHTNQIIARNRRIGLSMMGIFKMYERLGTAECIRWWDQGYAEVRKWDNIYSEWLGCNKSIKVTSVKPGGTVPLLLGEEGGMKIPTAEYYFRTIRIEENSPIVSACREAGYRVEKDLTSARTAVVYFPIHDPVTMRTSDKVSIWEQMELLANLQAYWADNMVSNTINFRTHEAGEISKVIGMYSTRIKSVSFLPLTSHGYAQAPYIPISKEAYEEAVKDLKPLNLSGVKHEVDEKYCTGEVCSIA